MRNQDFFDFPNGDYGGNEFPLEYKDTVDNLHALWDSVMYEYHDTVYVVIFVFDCYSCMIFSQQKKMPKYFFL